MPNGFSDLLFIIMDNRPLIFIADRNIQSVLFGNVFAFINRMNMWVVCVIVLKQTAIVDPLVEVSV